ncbi:MAG: transporter [Deltaproteobacteria bacterium]|nr:transporter [Deltaproteobacteria bacterium]
MVELLAANPLLLLFVVAAIGYPLGRVRIFGFSFGIAAVLFVGLAAGAYDARLELPPLVYLFGLVVFVYTIGLASGRSFLDAFRRSGLRDNGLALGVLALATLTAVLLARALGYSAPLAAGLFCGSLTNTPALAAVVEVLSEPGSDARLRALPVVGYSVAYPMGVIGSIVALALARRILRVDLAKEAAQLRDLGASGEKLINRTVRITRRGIEVRSLDEWRAAEHWPILFGRFQKGDTVDLVVGEDRVQVGDVIGLIGGAADVERATQFLGEVADVSLDLDRSHLDFRRIFVSNGELAGRTLAELALPQTHGAMITRVRRGDLDILPTGATRLELGDRVRVVCRRERMDAVTELFGDSYRRLSEIDVMSFGLGIAFGLLLGLLPIPLPGGGHLSLGLAGGPLIVALIFGAIGRTGPIIWLLPYSANLTLRQMGLVLFLAGVGTRSGHAFLDTLTHGGGVSMFLAGGLITLVVSTSALVIGHHFLKIPFSLLSGILAGIDTQPATLAYAGEQTGNDLPQVGYASVFPLATVAKIVMAQLILSLAS